MAPEQDFDLPFFFSNRQPLTPEMTSLTKELSTIDDTECLTRLKSIFSKIPSNILGGMLGTTMEIPFVTLFHLRQNHRAHAG